MEKKMYNQPATAVTMVEAITAIVCATQPIKQKPEDGNGEEAGAPGRYPQF